MKSMTAMASSAEALRPGFIPGAAPQTDFAAEKPPQPEANDLEPSVYRFILKHSMRQQILLLLLTLSSFPFLYYSLDLPKTIVNQAIGGKHFPAEFLGFEFDQVPYLMILSALFIALVFINGAFKYFINTYKGQIGERMLRRFRYSLYQRLLCFPLSYFHKNSSAQIIPMITVECEQLGGFIGDAFNLPLFQGGQLLTMIFFMFMQDPILGVAAIALYPVQGYVIPKLQFKVNQLGKQRIRTVRQVADRVQESAAGIVEIQANDTVKLRLTDFAHILGIIYDIRFEIYRRKFFAKFLNNFIGQLTPFFFYSLGGYLVIKGSLSFGALVAVIAAYKDLASPWKELLDFYQIKENSRITYEQIVEQFQPAGMTDARLLLEEPERIMPLTGELSVANLSLAEDDRARVVDAVSFTVKLDEHAAARTSLRCCWHAACGRRVAGSRSAAPISRNCRWRWSAGASAMSAPCRIYLPGPCATISCSGYGIFRCGRPNMMRRRRAAASASFTKRGAQAISNSICTPIGSITKAPASPTRRS